MTEILAASALVASAPPVLAAVHGAPPRDAYDDVRQAAGGKASRWTSSLDG
ncbi:hypothetical protein [Actinomadura chokoriensis]|uniref:hypothetical protein n=1 Tax=Actinomadura chokoriensis TaxID=454156 RepID=UPI0031F78895